MQLEKMNCCTCTKQFCPTVYWIKLEFKECYNLKNVYYVRRGDTLGRIAIRFGTTVKRLLLINPQITRPDLIFPGEYIILR